MATWRIGLLAKRNRNRAESVCFIQGYVYDASREPLDGVQIILYDENQKEELYTCNSDSDERYLFYIPSEQRSYCIKVKKEGYGDTTLYGINVNDTVTSCYQESAYLQDSSEDEEIQSVLRICDAFHINDATNELERVYNAHIIIREGINNRDGGTVAEGYSDVNGCLPVYLEPGMYTAEIQKGSFATTFVTIFICIDMTELQLNISPLLGDGEVRIVLTWGVRPNDLDSHLFTPILIMGMLIPKSCQIQVLQ